LQGKFWIDYLLMGFCSRPLGASGPKRGPKTGESASNHRLFSLSDVAVGALISPVRSPRNGVPHEPVERLADRATLAPLEHL
jgi:hypothetical protein